MSALREADQMADQPEALRWADFLDQMWAAEPAAELRRLHAVNAELLEALKLALSAHGVLLLSDPPQEAWTTYGVEQKARAAIARAEGEPK